MGVRQGVLAQELAVLCDYREQAIIRELKRYDLQVREVVLEVGDFVISQRVVVEHKTTRDFTRSILDGRLFEQAQALATSFELPVLVVEGEELHGIAPNALAGAIASLLLDFGLSLVRVKDASEAARLIYWLAKREHEQGRKPVSKSCKKPKELYKLQECVVKSLPGVSTVLARRLLEHFKTVQEVFTASQSELQRVKGIGRKLAKRIRNVLVREYSVERERSMF